MRLIDADALQDKMHDECCGECESCKKYIWNGERSLCGLIEEAPTVPLPDFKDGYKQAVLDGKTNYSRPQGKWIITAEDNDGIHRIQCPFCGYEKGSNCIDYIIVTFENFPPFCESCGAELRSRRT